MGTRETSAGASSRRMADSRHGTGEDGGRGIMMHCRFNGLLKKDSSITVTDLLGLIDDQKVNSYFRPIFTKQNVETLLGKHEHVRRCRMERRPHGKGGY